MNFFWDKLPFVIIALFLGWKLGAFKASEKKVSQPKPIDSPDHSLEGQLKALSEVGIQLAAQRSIDELLISYSREDYEGEPYRLLLIVMGREVEGEPWGRLFSDGVWYLDTECIEGDGAYVQIAERFARLTRGELELTGVFDTVDIEEGVSELRFTCGGRERVLEPVVNDDWIDPEITEVFARLPEELGLRGRFTYLNLGGQDCLLGYADKEQLEKIRLLTGLDFVWLS